MASCTNRSDEFDWEMRKVDLTSSDWEKWQWGGSMKREEELIERRQEEKRKRKITKK